MAPFLLPAVFIKSLKLQIGEDPEYDKVIARHKAGCFPDDPTKDMIIAPVNFNKKHKAMLGHCKIILENEGGKIAINPVFDKLITALRTAVDKDGALDKESTSYNDIFDAFRLAPKFYQFKEEQKIVKETDLLSRKMAKTFQHLQSMSCILA